jgi:hypothetical protein
MCLYMSVCLFFDVVCVCVYVFFFIRVGTGTLYFAVACLLHFFTLLVAAVSGAPVDGSGIVHLIFLGHLEIST